jgi:hypothetical protein
VFDIYKIDVQCRKSNNKHPCEFVLTRAVKLLHVFSLRLHTLEYCEKTYHQFYFYQSTLYNKETRAIGRLMKIGFPCHTLTVRSSLRMYVHYVMTGCSSGHDTVRLLCGFSGRTSFSLHCWPILKLLRPTKAF